jgi:pimeloyl-ACP methyl ester carboxylesterase
MMARPIVLIHGMFMTPLCWEHWVQRFSDRGRTVVAVPWPGRDAPVEGLRAAHPDPRVGDLGIAAIMARLTEAIEKLPDKPALIGHSMGGLMLQLLLQRELGAAGVALHSAPPAGVFTTTPSFVKANWPMINPLESVRKPHMITLEEFAYAFANTLSPNEQKAAWERYAVPESRRIPHESLGKSGHVDFAAPHPPLLFLAGGKDHIIPAALNESNFRHYSDVSGVTEYRLFEGHDHLSIIEPGWEEVADASIDWLDAHDG